MSVELIKLHKGAVTKKIIKPGKGESPKKLSKCTVSYVGTDENGNVFDSSQSRNSDFTFELGSHRIIKGWEIALQSMKQGEVSIFTIQPELAYQNNVISDILKPNSTVIYEIELKSVDNTRCFENRIKELNKTKEQGNNNFRGSRYNEAIGKYEECLRLVKLFPISGLNEEEEKQLFQLSQTYILNIAMTFIKIEKYAQAIRYCDLALKKDPKNEKALYRKGLSLGEMGNFENAIEIFTFGLECYKNNKSMKTKLNFYKKKMNKTKNTNKK
ncbi:peptidylprolyl isomerase [Anaeramoeba flamelloides]|uniref:peptidylprolyl isomerase n=1 Tax=Anaeramoeba flamelloides TaxID=1746091 RepID=A0AAV7Z737_9EUKA|nr:peptidylprolyl isomerase [Anaeramoeba flamelloides]